MLGSARARSLGRSGYGERCTYFCPDTKTASSWMDISLLT